MLEARHDALDGAFGCLGVLGAVERDGVEEVHLRPGK
jgi:hypothetical protein